MRVVGISQKIRLSWLDFVLDRVAQTRDEKHLRSMLDVHLQGDLPGTESRAKASGIILHIWFGIDPKHAGIRDRAVAMLPRISGGERIWLHWGMATLAYPFFRELAEVVGRMLTLHDSFTTSQVQSRLTKAWGDRTTSKEAAQKLITSLVDFGVLKKEKGRFRSARKLVAPCPSIQLWLLEAVLTSSASDEIEAHQLLRLPELFPFALTVGVRDLRKHEGFAVYRQGLDMDMVAVRQATTRTKSKTG